MKKILLLVLFALLLTINCNAKQIQVTEEQYNNYIHKKIASENKLKIQLNDILKDIKFESNEFIYLKGKISSDNKLSDYQISLSNISDEKQELILNKLKSSEIFAEYVFELYNPDVVFNKFNLFLVAKPKYAKDSGFNILLGITNDKIEKSIKEEFSGMQNYYQEILVKLYPEFIKLQEQYNFSPKILSIEATIDKNGNLLEPRVIESINEEIDSYMVNLLQKYSPFKKLPDTWNYATFRPTFNFGVLDVISNNIKNNIENKNSYLALNYDMVVKVSLDKKGNVISCEMVKSSNNKLIDNEIINAVKKTNLIECRRYILESGELYLKIISDIKYNKKQNFSVVVQKDLGDIDEVLKIAKQYTLQIDQQAKRNWIKNKLNFDSSFEIGVFFNINKDGQVINTSIVKSSGIKEADDLAIKSILDGAPYPKFPQEYKLDIMPVQLRFNYSNYGYFDKYKNDKSSSKYYQFIQKTSKPSK